MSSSAQVRWRRATRRARGRRTCRDVPRDTIIGIASAGNHARRARATREHVGVPRRRDRAISAQLVERAGLCRAARWLRHEHRPSSWRARAASRMYDSACRVGGRDSFEHVADDNSGLPRPSELRHVAGARWSRTLLEPASARLDRQSRRLHYRSGDAQRRCRAALAIPSDSAPHRAIFRARAAAAGRQTRHARPLAADRVSRVARDREERRARREIGRVDPTPGERLRLARVALLAIDDSRASAPGSRWRGVADHLAGGGEDCVLEPISSPPQVMA